MLAAVPLRQYLIWPCCGRVCVCVRERDGRCVCVCERERERERDNVCCMCTTDSDRKTTTKKGTRFPEENNEQ